MCTYRPGKVWPRFKGGKLKVACLLLQRRRGPRASKCALLPFGYLRRSPINPSVTLPLSQKPQKIPAFHGIFFSRVPYFLQALSQLFYASFGAYLMMPFRARKAEKSSPFWVWKYKEKSSFFPEKNVFLEWMSTLGFELLRSLCRSRRCWQHNLFARAFRSLNFVEFLAGKGYIMVP